ncbi:DUF3159 domain-containing protein [Arsenicicoccus piscis]|nr:DUF3159 domain-containing protein [Arsenicicoccus piscis]
MAADDEGLASVRAHDTVERLIRERLATVLGGWRGSLEAALPTVVFVLVWVVRADLRGAVIASLVTAALLGVARLVTRGTMQFVLSSLLGTALAAYFAMRSGRAEAAFLPGILISAGYFVATLLSVVTRWPVVGFLVGMAEPDYKENPLGWRQDRAMVRVCNRLTLVLVGLFAVRLLVAVPLYLAGQVAALGIAKIVLGWPLYLAAVGLMGAILVRGRTPR